MFWTTGREGGSRSALTDREQERGTDRNEHAGRPLGRSDGPFAMKGGSTRSQASPEGKMGQPVGRTPSFVRPRAAAGQGRRGGARSTYVEPRSAAVWAGDCPDVAQTRPNSPPTALGKPSLRRRPSLAAPLHHRHLPLSPTMAADQSSPPRDDDDVEDIFASFSKLQGERDVIHTPGLVRFGPVLTQAAPKGTSRLRPRSCSADAKLTASAGRWPRLEGQAISVMADQVFSSGVVRLRPPARPPAPHPAARPTLTRALPALPFLPRSSPRWSTSA